MNTNKFLIASVVMAAIFTSCGESPNSIAQEKVNKYSFYVDSVSNVETKDLATNWKDVESNYKNYKMEANDALLTIDYNPELQRDINKTTKKYEDFKSNLKKEIAVKSELDSKQIIRKTLLGKDFNGSDMTYAWINKDNILSVYQNFVDKVEKNKDSYSRENWDEIKLMYEAIDTRKNTVEKEGLSSEDNRKIAALKLKFAPMYTFSRMGARSDENQTAKQ